MSKLCQVIAVANGTKGRAQKAITEAYHKMQKQELLSGIARRYRPKDEDGDQLPPESKKVHYRAQDAIGDVETALTELFDIVATQDTANTKASADVVVDGRTILSSIPVTHLLFLEKQLVDIGTFIGKLPTLDTSEEWDYSEEANCFATNVKQTTRSKKIPRNHVKAEATKEHPAQVEVWMEDVIVGTWDTTNFSGAIPESRKHELQERARKLLDAVKMAREEANSLEVETVKTGKAVFDFLFSETSASSS